ncbi:MAG TPA: metal ABC transporter substrate-binding protein [Methylomirabilota bacterium]|nr:metal ABC transporter substrate-binding protein [Methylomirabilota bacterium]
MLLALLVAAALPVAATTTDLRDLVAAVGGDRVRVESLTDPRHDPHARELVPRQLGLLKDARLVVRIGLDHEPWLPRAAAAAGARANDLDLSRAVLVLDADIPRLRADARPHLHAYGNPHYWLDPENARPMTARIEEALAALQPDDASVFAANRHRFLARLDAALVRWRARLASFAGTRVVVAHDTWPYFARRFGLVVVGALEDEPGLPPSPAHLAQLIERMRASGVRIIVAEPGAAPAVLRRLANATGARVVTLAPSVGAEPEARDYLSLFELNVARLALALSP